jgi:hypothetical protein
VEVAPRHLEQQPGAGLRQDKSPRQGCTQSTIRGALAPCLPGAQEQAGTAASALKARGMAALTRCPLER